MRLVKIKIYLSGVITVMFSRSLYDVPVPYTWILRVNWFLTPPETQNIEAELGISMRDSFIDLSM